MYDYFLEDILRLRSVPVWEMWYANLPKTRVAKPAGYPNDTYTNPNNNLAKVNVSGNKIGPSIILKVMAGDIFNIRVSSWNKKK